VLLAAPFMAQADATIANAATPSIRVGLGASGAALELVAGVRAGAEPGRADRRAGGAGQRRGADVPQALTGIQRHFSGPARARAIGRYAIALSAGAVTGQILGRARAALARDPRIIVDLTALEFIDCCALGALGRVRAQARQAGGDLLLAAPCGPVRRVLALTGLIDVFSVYASVEDAARIDRPEVTAG
jgi:anti-anti-sigma factor